MLCVLCGRCEHIYAGGCCVYVCMSKCRSRMMVDIRFLPQSLSTFLKKFLLNLELIDLQTSHCSGSACLSTLTNGVGTLHLRLFVGAGALNSGSHACTSPTDRLPSFMWCIY